MSYGGRETSSKFSPLGDNIKKQNNALATIRERSEPLTCDHFRGSVANNVSATNQKRLQNNLLNLNLTN